MVIFDSNLRGILPGKNKYEDSKARARERKREGNRREFRNRGGLQGVRNYVNHKASRRQNLGIESVHLA